MQASTNSTPFVSLHKNLAAAALSASIFGATLTQLPEAVQAIDPYS